MIGLILGIPALIVGVRGPPGGFEEEDEERVGEPDPQQDADQRPAEEELVQALRIRRAAAVGLGVWLLTGLALFSHMARLHPRYVEGFTPAVAAILGIGLAWACSTRGRLALAGLVLAMLVTVYYAERLLYGTPGVWWITLLGAIAAIVLAISRTMRPGRQRSGGGALAACTTLAAALLAVLPVGVKADLRAIRDKVSDAGFVGQLPGDVQGPLSAYLRAHKDGARYEVAAESATQIGSLIVKDGLPVVVLTTYNARVYTTIGKLKRMIAAGQVRYAYLSTFCTHKASSVNAACAKPVLWIREHGTDVSLQAGLPHHKLLYLLPGARP